MLQMLKIVKNFYKICFNKSVPYSDYLSSLRTGHPLGKQISKGASSTKEDGCCDDK